MMMGLCSPQGIVSVGCLINRGGAFSLLGLDGLFLFWIVSNNRRTKQKTGGLHYVIAPWCYYSAFMFSNG